VPHQIFVLGADQELIYSNRVSLEYYGLSLEDLQNGGDRARLVHPDDLTRVLEEARRGFSAAAPFASEARFRRHDGQYRWFLIQLNPVHDEGGSVICWYSTRTDIDDKKQAEARQKLLMDSLPTMVATCRPDGSADYINERWLKYYGLALDDLRDWRWTIVI